MLQTRPQSCRENADAGSITNLRPQTYQTGREGEAYDRIVAGVDHHLVPEIPDVLNWVAHFGVVVEGWSREFLRKLALQDFLGERGVRNFDSLIGCRTIT